MGLNFFILPVQTDTCLAIEAKYMKRWEFDSIEQSARCISSWFPGTYDELCLLKEYLESSIGIIFTQNYKLVQSI